MATADNNYFYTTWGDNRLSDAYFANQPDVRFAKIPVSGCETDTASLAPSRGTLTVSATTTTVSSSEGVVPSHGGATANVIGPQGQGSNGQAAPSLVDQFLTLPGNNLGFKATQTVLPGLVNEVSALDSALLTRFDALLSMGFDAHRLQVAQDTLLRDLLLASLS
jgi:hypothetical protein